MIISASRRTDIPAHYAQWVCNRLRQGYVLVRNPYNFNQVTQVSLDPSVVDCLVFWTKNSEPLLPLLEEIEHLGHHCYFQFTLTPYGAELEQALPDKQRLVTIFQELARRVGPERVIWRYDPILFTPTYTVARHVASFARLASQLGGFTRRCTISLLRLYAKCKINLRDVSLVNVPEEAIAACIARLQAIARDQGIRLDACADTFLQERCGLPAARCIDDQLIASLLGMPVQLPRDAGQRPACCCCASIDIGAYDTCANGCRYCYANTSGKAVARNQESHDPASPLLAGQLTGAETITVKPMRSVRHPQQNLFLPPGQERPGR